MDARIRVLLKIIDERGGSLPMTSKEIGRLLGLGEARVLRLFSTEVGKTLRRYMLEVRMARASRMLMDVVTPIKMIAFDCGYTVVSNFYRDFKRVHGLGPTEMRRRHLTKRLQESESGYFVLRRDVRNVEIASSGESPLVATDRQIAA